MLYDPRINPGWVPWAMQKSLLGHICLAEIELQNENENKTVLILKISILVLFLIFKLYSNFDHKLNISISIQEDFRIRRSKVGKYIKIYALSHYTLHVIPSQFI